MTDKDRARKTEFQQSRRGGRQKRGPIQSEGRISDDVLDILSNHPEYDKSARPNDTRAVLAVEYVPDIGSGDVPALHARWQEQGWVSHALTKADAEALHRLGFKTIKNKDVNCEDFFWRKRKVSHLWISVLALQDGDDGRASMCWACSEVSKAVQLIKQKRWEILSKIDEPAIPFFNEYEISHNSMMREALIEAWHKIRDRVPLEVTGEDFWEVLKMVCDEGVERFNVEYSDIPGLFGLASVEVNDWTKHVRSGVHREMLDKAQQQS